MTKLVNSISGARISIELRLIMRLAIALALVKGQIVSETDGGSESMEAESSRLRIHSILLHLPAPHGLCKAISWGLLTASHYTIDEIPPAPRLVQLAMKYKRHRCQ